MATDWVTLSNDDAYRVLSADEVSTLANTQLQPGDYLTTDQGQLVTSQGQQFMLTPPVVEIVTEIVDEIALEIRADMASGGYDLDDSPKIPKVLRGHGLAILPFKLWSRLGGQMLDVDGARQRLLERSEDILRRVRDGNYDGLPKAASQEPQGERLVFKSQTKLRL